MKILLAHTYLRLRQLLREPSYLASTMIFPALFFLIFALPNADTPEKARFLLASFTIFAVLGVCFFQFGIHQAQEIRSGWNAYLSTLPVHRWQMLIAQWVSAMVAGFCSCLAVYVAVRLSTDLNYGVGPWLGLCGVVLLLAIPFALFSAAVACWTSTWAALPLFNMIYILSSFAGGLWMPPAALPAKVEPISRWLPTRHFGEVLWKFVLEQPVESHYLWRLGGFTLAAGIGLTVSTRAFRHRQKI